MAATVYQIFNERLLELFIGATERPLSELVESLDKRPPAALREWKPVERQRVFAVQMFATMEEARRYVDAQRGAKSPWKTLFDL